MAESKKIRFLFLDLLRGWAAILMIEGHVLNSLLRTDLKETAAFHALHFIGGLVPSTFLFLTGFTFMVVAQRKWDDYLHLKRPLFNQLGRLFFILFVGYALHLPYLSLRKTFQESTPEQLASFFQVDALQNIAVSLFLLLVLLLVLRHRGHLAFAALAVALGIIYATPVMWEYDFSRSLALPLASYLNADHGSYFPLFPWTAFVLLGAVTSHLFLTARARGAERGMVRNFFLGGLGLILGGIISDRIPIQIYRTYDFWHTSPSFFMIQLGLTLIILATFWLYNAKWRPQSSFLQYVGQQSLFVYVLHLVLLHGSVVPHPYLEKFLSLSLNFGECALVFLGITGVCCTAGYMLHHLKVNARIPLWILKYSLVGLFIYSIITRPY